jgi:hypothetical protein
MSVELDSKEKAIEYIKSELNFNHIDERDSFGSQNPSEFYHTGKVELLEQLQVSNQKVYKYRWSDEEAGVFYFVSQNGQKFSDYDHGKNWSVSEMESVLENNLKV